MDTRNLREFIKYVFIVFCLCRIAASQVCNNTWITRPKTSVQGGTKVTGTWDASSTPASCQALCLSQAKCVGIDFNANNECWLIFNNTVVSKNLDDWVTHYQLKRNQYSCTALCASPRSISWTETRDAHVIGGKEKPSLNQSACEIECFNNNDCRGFDWDPQNAIKCWHVLNPNPVQMDSPGVTHYHKDCSDGGLKIATPGPPAPASPAPTKDFSTFAPTSTTIGKSSVDPWVDNAAEMSLVDAHAIKPAYIVLAGLGAGCILMVIIGVSVICCYPLKGGKGYSHTKGFKTKKTKVTKPQGELHTRQPKTLVAENIDMGTISARNTYDSHKTYDDHNTLNSQKQRHSMESNKHVDDVAYNVDHNTHAERSSYNDIHSDHGSHADRNSHMDRNSVADHNTGTYNGSTLDHKDRQSIADHDSNADRNSTLGRKDRSSYEDTAYNTINEEVHESPYNHSRNDDNYD